MSNYATKAEFKNTARVDKWDFVKKSDLAKIKSDVNKLDIDKLKNEKFKQFEKYSSTTYTCNSVKK